MRDLSRQRGSMQTAPVVFTAGLGLAGGELFSKTVGRVFGPMNWVISQSPEVAIDAQVAACDGGILVNWDLRLDAVPESGPEDLRGFAIALGYKFGTTIDMGPGYFPRILSLVLIGFGIVTFVKGLRNCMPVEGGWAWLPLLLLSASLLLFGFLIERARPRARAGRPVLRLGPCRP